MARKSTRRAAPQEDIELNEVDAFNANQEKILLEEAGNYAPTQDDHSESSEEDVMGINDVDSDDSDEEVEASDAQEEESEAEEEGWGGRQNYYGGDDIDGDEDAKQMTEEAIRQQKKHLKELAIDDYMDEDMVDEWKKTAAETEQPQTIQQISISTGDDSISKLDDKERNALLKNSFPEFIPLLKELHEYHPKLIELRQREQNSLLEIKIAALSAYLSSISSYFAIFTENLRSDEPFVTMKDNEVMESILSSREVWRQARELPDEPLDTADVSDEELSNVSETFGGLEEEIQDSDVSEATSENEFIDEDVDVAEDDDLNIDITSKRKIKLAPGATVNFGDYTEAAVPDEVDLDDKKRRKRSLRFYTSKIDQAAAKNSKDRYTGDMDIPYKERLFERQQRLIEEARKRGVGEDKAQLGDDLDGEDINSDDEKLAHDINDDEYYQQVKQQRQDKKNSRREAHDLAVKAAKEGKLQEVQEQVGEHGKRALNFQILKNKGLTPHRNKDNRNSRVKKRKKYEKAQKKLKSVRQVYDANNRGPYQGEKTGIKKGISRSVKLA